MCRDTRLTYCDEIKRLVNKYVVFIIHPIVYQLIVEFCLYLPPPPLHLYNLTELFG